MDKGKCLSREEILNMPVSPEMFEAARHPSKERLEESRQWWSKKYGRELTTEDAAEIHRNLFGLLKFLAEWDIEQQRRAAGGHVPNETKMREIRYEIRHLEKQIEALDKMIKHWRKDELQRLALEQAVEALRQQHVKRERDLTDEMVGPKKTESTP